jgi:protein ImuB
MSRYACLLVPDLALAAALRAEPPLRERPLAIIEPAEAGTGGPMIVAGLLCGLSVAQARTVEPALEIRTLSHEGVQAAVEALVDVALSIGPRVMEERAGLVFVDLDGLDALFPTPRGLLTALESRLSNVGLDASRLGLGPTRTTAELAARAGAGGHIVGPEQRTFLAPLPIDLLEPPDELADRLWRWGIRTLGELANLPRAALGARLGEEGVRLARCARGQDLTPFRAAVPRLHFEESMQLDFGIDNLEALGFVLRTLFDRLTRRLRLRGLAVRRIWLELTDLAGEPCTREVELAAPTLELGVLTSLARLAIEKSPPTSGETIERVRVIATPGSVETAQLDLFMPPLPAPAELAMTVARIESIIGPGRVAAPDVADSHLPDAPHVQIFRFTEVGEERRGASAVPEALAPRACMGQRALRPPRRARVRGQHPEHVAPLEDGFTGGRVLNRAGPWRFFGEWWGETPFARDYYDVELSDGGVYRLYHNLEDGSWYVDGVYD